MVKEKNLFRRLMNAWQDCGECGGNCKKCKQPALKSKKAGKKERIKKI
jgi:hypothetical protein